jgi:basic membrane protein A
LVSPQPTEPPQTSATTGKICEVTDSSGLHDESFNELAYVGVQVATARFGWDSAVLEAGTATDFTQPMLQFLKAGCDLVVAVAAFNLSDAVEAVAEANPEQKFLAIDWVYDPPYDNIWSQTYATHQAAFLAGYVAAGTTQTGKVGTFGGVKFKPVTDFMNGFALGVAYYNQKHARHVEVLGWDVAQQDGSFIGNFENTDDGRQMADDFLAAGADIILPVAGPAGVGAAAAVKEHGHAYLIGVDADWAVTFPEYAGVVLTSIEKKVDVSVVLVVQAVVNGEFVGGTHVGTLAMGEVGISPFHALDHLVPRQVKSDLEQIEAGIIAGEIQTLP